MLEELKGKKPFLYEDAKGIVAISKNKVVRLSSNNVPTSILWFERYNKIDVENENDENHVREVIRKISTSASLLTEPHIDDKGNVISCNYIKIAEYWGGLTKEEKESIKKQVNKLTQLHKTYGF